jgi:hypothetical protein
VHNNRTEFLRNEGEMFGTVSVHGVSLLGVELTAFDVMHRSRIHNDLGSNLPQYIAHGIEVRDLNVGMAEAMHFVACGPKRRDDIGPKLAVRSDYRDGSHATGLAIA